MTDRVRLASPAAVLLLALAACGGDGGGSAGAGDAALEVVPASALAYVSLNADLESGQWETLRENADKFPDSERLVDDLLAEVADDGVSWERDVEPAVGPVVAIVALNTDDDLEPEPVVLTQPEDEAKLDALFDQAGEDVVRREIGGWQAIAEEDAHLDAYAAALRRGTLSGNETFEEATADLPGEALMTVYVDGDAFRAAAREAGEPGEIPGFGRLRWLAGAAEAVDEGIRFQATSRATGAQAVENYRPTLLERVPGDAIAVGSFKGAGGPLDALREQEPLDRAAGRVERLLGVTLDELSGLLADEGVFYVRPSAPIPELTLLLRVTDEAATRQTLDRLAGRLVRGFDAQRGTTTLDGAPASYVRAEALRMAYGVNDGVAIVTTARVLDRPGEGERLDDSAAFGTAREASGLGDETAGFFYVDLERAVSLVGGFAGVAGEEMSPRAERNLRSLKAFVSHASRDGDDTRFVALLSVE